MVLDFLYRRTDSKALGHFIFLAFSVHFGYNEENMIAKEHL